MDFLRCVEIFNLKIMSRAVEPCPPWVSVRARGRPVLGWMAGWYPPVFLCLAVTASCGGDTAGSAGAMPLDPDSVMTGSTGGTEPGEGTTVPKQGDLPCDLQALLNERCGLCHGATPAYGAPMTLTSHAALTAPSLSTPGESALDLAIMRAHDDTKPMPPVPNPRLSDDEIALFEAYRASGAKRPGLRDQPWPVEGAYRARPLST